MSGDGATALVVEGEASESDTDESTSNIASKAFVISGEAPESDDEGAARQAPAEDAASVRSAASPPPAPRRAHHDSLLHRKLCESNARLRSSVEGLLRVSAGAAVARLTQADKMLLSAQENLRRGNANLSLARARLKQISAGLEKANISAVLTTVKTR